MEATNGDKRSIFSAMTFNLWADYPPTRTWMKRRYAITALLKKYQPDVIGFQEVNKERILYLAEQLSEYEWVGASRDGRDFGEFNPIFYRKQSFCAKQSVTFWLSPTPERISKGWDAACPRIATCLELTNGSASPFLIINTHFDHFGRHARRHSTHLILEFIAQWRYTAPVLLMGDLNAWESSWTYRLLTAHGRLYDGRQIVEQPPEGPRYTWRGWTRAGLGQQRLDYIMVRGFKVRRYAVFAEKVEGVYPSDHLPVFCEVEW